MGIFSELVDPLTRVKGEFPREAFIELGIPRYALPKMHSDLPVKANFDDYKSILKHWVYKAFLHRQAKLKPKGPVVLFTWVMADGRGDWSAQIVAADVLKSAFPDLDLRLITVISETERGQFSHPLCPTHLFRYGEKIPASLFEASFIIQMPTYFPKWHEPENSITIGEYGFLDSEWFHPKSRAICMGLHSLEKGLLFGKKPSPLPLIPNQFFAYLRTERGYAVYLHALLNFHPSDIILYICNPLPLLKVLQTEDFHGLNLSCIFFSDDTHQTRIRLAEEGRTLRIFCRGAMPHVEVQRLMLTSQPFTGCRGDRSFTECVAAGKCFFYDPPIHMRPFIHDLLDVVKHYLFYYPGLHDYIKSFLNTTTPAKILGGQIRELLLDPTTTIGIAKLNELLQEEFTFDPTLTQLIGQKDQKKLELFLEGNISLENLLGRSD